MKDWMNVLPDKVKIMNKHFTPGRGGAKIKYIVRHHVAGISTTEQVWNTWQNRAASAHYIVEPDGTIGQLVWDRDTAWANAHARANRESLTIEHSNSGGAPGWPINEVTRREGARLTAALCRFYGLGRPQYGVNVFDHRDFYATSCSHHLAAGEKYHDEYMAEAQRFYDELTNPTPEPEEDFMAALSPDEQRDFYAKVNEIHNALFAPTPSTVPGSNYVAARVDYFDLIDRKLEELHVEYHGRTSKAQQEADQLTNDSDNHDPEDEDKHDGEDG